MTGSASYYYPQGLGLTAGQSSGGYASAKQLSYLDNDGKILSGTDRDGDHWTITVTGPGSVIVTDITPGDGALDDPIDTIQLVGTSPTLTHVTGQVMAGTSGLSDGQINFDQLIDLNGVRSIDLKGFDLAETVTPVSTQLNGGFPIIYLPGGVGTLAFNNINAPNDTAFLVEPYQIVIGQSTTPLTVKPKIEFGNIFNTTFDSSLAENPAGVVPTTPTVQLLVNGEIRDLSYISSTQTPIAAAEQYAFPVSGTTGRTSIRATAIDKLNVAGSANNTTISKAAVPFSSGFSGLNKLGTAKFGGTSDGLAIDVSGPIKGLKFAKGLGNPTGSSVSPLNYGTPLGTAGNASFGLEGGQVTATKIGHVKAGPANTVLSTTDDPTQAQSVRTRNLTLFASPGNALTSAAITTSGSIGSVAIKGDLQTSEIKTGYTYTQYEAGLEGTRKASHISHVKLNGNLIDSVISSTYRPTDAIYGNQDANGNTQRRGRAGQDQGDRHRLDLLDRHDDDPRQHRRRRLRPQEGREAAASRDPEAGQRRSCAVTFRSRSQLPLDRPGHSPGRSTSLGS